MKGNCAAAAPKKKEAKKQEAKPAAKKEEKKKDEKPKANIDLLPPSDFNLYDFKTFFVNHKD